ncbi:MAG: hypothetical protein AB1489_21405 [Acidobacteriota bacterium]
MAKEVLEKVVDEIKTLTPAEQIQVRDLINELLLSPEAIDRLIQEDMLKEGLVSEIKPPRSSLPERNFKPIEVKGKPVSETIIEERR